jgi:hypothetical protein
MEIMKPLVELGGALGTLLVEFLKLAVAWSPLIAWVAWWLWAADWRKLWPTLAQGAWLPVVLLSIMVALVWSALTPTSVVVAGLAEVSNFWWQLGAVGLVVGVALFCGWLQILFGWQPAELDLNAELAHAHEHEHAHAPAH